MFKLCPLIHRWSKRPKQWVGKNGVVISKRCRHCGTLKEEGKYIEIIKIKVKELYKVAKNKGGLEWE